jgi:hypothetical protein
MLRAIFAAMANALLGIFKYGFGFAVMLISWPFQLFAGRSRPQLLEIDIEAIKARMAPHHLTPKEIAQSQMRDSNIAFSWIIGVRLDRCTRPFPSAMSKTMSAWLRGLSYRQLVQLQNAGAIGIFEHVTGKQVVDLVPRQQMLKPAVLRFPPAKKFVDPTAPRLVRC